MQLSDLPRRFPVPFANSAASGYIRAIPTDHVSPSSTDAPASLHDGFPPETFQPEASGGIPPNGMDINGILNQLSAWARWEAAGGSAQFNADFSAAIGGYPKFAVLASTTVGILWISTADANTTDPDGSSSANWLPITTGKLEQDGEVSATMSAGYVGSVVFASPFPTACTSVVLTEVNASASDRRDNWVSLVSKSTTGFTFVVQGSATGGDNTIDGFDWQARGR